MQFFRAGKVQVKQTAKLKNISLGGAYVTLGGNADPGTAVDLRIIDNENRFGRQLGVEVGQDALSLRIHGKVVRLDKNESSYGWGLGLEFTGPVRFARIKKSQKHGDG